MTPRRPTSRVPSGPLVTTMIVAALLLALYLATSSVDPAVDRPGGTCADRVVYHQARLRDC